MRAIAVTTIADQDSMGVSRLIRLSEICSAELVLIGDKKSPAWNQDRLPSNVHYFSIKDQNNKWPKLSKLIPLNHYGRKNLAYLWAIENGVELLLDTDDDNFSELDVFSQNINSYRSLPISKEWINVYAYFGQTKLWPRGLPLEEAMYPLLETVNKNEEPEWHCFQAVVDGDPDLDAIGRMLYPESHTFEDLPPLLLQKGQFCPTNSQATIWKKELFPCLYLPVTAPFRMTDIWRGMVMNGFLLSRGYKTLFGKLGVNQLRNAHNLLSDFKDEVAGHLSSRMVKQIADKYWLEENSFDYLLILKEIYHDLCQKKIVGANEEEVLNVFLEEVERFA